MKALYLMGALILVNGACQTKQKKEEGTVATAVQEDSATLLSKRPTADSPRSAADRLVRALYFEHNKKDNPFREKNRALLDEYFAKKTADLIWKNGSKLKPATNNPLFDAPDASVKKMWVEPAAVGGTRALVYVTFEKEAKPQEVQVELQQASGRWYITDLHYPSGKQLTQLLQ